ncbi:MAG: O-antigen ligase family protein [Bdellovibrionales bacterium]
MLEKLFFLGLMFVPFTSIEGISGLGEIQHEISAYIFIAMMGLFVPLVLSRAKEKAMGVDTQVYLIPKIMAVMLTVIALSFAVNFLTIKDSVFFGRSGIEKFVTSTIVVFYGFGIAGMTYVLSDRQPWDKMILKPLLISVALCSIFAFFEMAGRFNGAMASLFKVISAPFYGTFEVMEWDTRLRSVAFEPPDFANSAGYMWPWILASVIQAKGRGKLLTGAAFLALNVMILLSEARTSFVVIGGLSVVFLGLLFVFSHKEDGRDAEKMMLPMTLIFALVVPSCLFLFVYFYDTLIYNVVAGDNISNLSRLASITAAMRMFESSPVFGFGFGQFAFHVTQYMPSWGYYSPEIQVWLFGNGEFWPAVYSVYARFAADMGVVGLLMWTGIWLYLARAIVVGTLRYRKETGELPFAAFPLVMSCFCVLFAGVPCDSIRSPMIWITMGLACRYLYSIKKISLSAQAQGST